MSLVYRGKTSMTKNRAWNPFSKDGKDAMSQAREAKKLAMQIRDQVLEIQAQHQELLLEQKRVSDELRKERRKNHFSDLFQTAVPIRNPNTLQ